MDKREYINLYLKHQPGCRRAIRPLGPESCDCKVADILAAWDAREAALQFYADFLLSGGRAISALADTKDEQ